MKPASKDRRRKLRLFRERARLAQKGLCHYCRRPMAAAGSAEARATPLLAETVEHRHPRSRGGTDSWTNLVLACKECNGAKASMNEQAFLDRHRR